MDTAKLNTYKKVIEALNDVNEQRITQPAGTPEKKLLDRSAILLEKLSWQVIADDVLAMADEINKSAADLKKLADKITETSNQLSHTADQIGKAATVVKVLVDIMTRAASAGLL